MNLNAEGEAFGDALLRYSFNTTSAVWPGAVATNAFKCVVRNDSEAALRKVEIDLMLTFKAAVPNGSALESGEIVAQRKTTIVIDRIGLGGKFEFWGAALTPHFAIVNFPATARARTVNGQTEIVATVVNNVPRGVVAGPSAG